MLLTVENIKDVIFNQLIYLTQAKKIQVIIRIKI